MVIDPDSALRFIDGWKALLLQAAGTGWRPGKPVPYERLAESREAVAADPARLDAAAAALERSGRPVDADVLRAARTLRLDHWVYLRDTAGHSVFLDSRSRAAYAVLGLTERLRDIVGESGVILRTGVVEFRGRYVCDGLVANVVWIGPNMRRELNDALARLRRTGAFHRGRRRADAEA